MILADKSPSTRHLKTSPVIVASITKPARCSGWVVGTAELKLETSIPRFMRHSFDIWTNLICTRLVNWSSLHLFVCFATTAQNHLVGAVFTAAPLSIKDRRESELSRRRRF